MFHCTGDVGRGRKIVRVSLSSFVFQNLLSASPCEIYAAGLYVFIYVCLFSQPIQLNCGDGAPPAKTKPTTKKPRKAPAKRSKKAEPVNTIENAFNKQAKTTKDVDEISVTSHTSISSSSSSKGGKTSKRDSESNSESNSDSSGSLGSSKPASKKVRCLFPAANWFTFADLCTKLD